MRAGVQEAARCHDIAQIAAACRLDAAIVRDALASMPEPLRQMLDSPFALTAWAEVALTMAGGDAIGGSPPPYMPTIH